MKKRTMVILMTAAILATAGTGFGVAYAAYTAETETIQINTTANDIAIPDFAHSFGSGSGAGTSAATAFIVENSIHLRNLAKLQNAGYFSGHNYFFKVASSFAWDNLDPLAPIGTATYPFTGTFDGNGRTISKLDASVVGQYAGLFGVVNGGTVKNIVLSAPTITIEPTNSTANYIGFIAGHLQSGTLSKCFVYGGNQTFAHNATLASEGGQKVSCADYFVGMKTTGTETALSFLSILDETTYDTTNGTWSNYTTCPSSASGVISNVTTSFSYSYYKASASATSVTQRS